MSKCVVLDFFLSLDLIVRSWAKTFYYTKVILMFLRNLHKWESSNTDGTQGRERENVVLEGEVRERKREEQLYVLFYLFILLLFFLQNNR